MKLIVFALSVLIFTACQPQAEATINETATILPAKAGATKVARDSVKPQRKQHYLVDNSRQLDQMVQVFPFDIDITSATGKPLNSETAFQANGKPTILLFWLTTCYPCRVELEAIKQNYPAWKKETDFNLFAVSTDFPTNYEKYLGMVKKNDWPFPAFHDTNREFRKVMPGGLNGLPQVFVLNAAGEVVYHKRRYSTGDEHKLYAKVKELAMK